MRIQEHVSLKELTTMKIGGTARYFCSVKKVEELTEVLVFAHEKRIEFAVLGGGSNILVEDGDLDMLVIKIAITGIDWQENREDVLVVSGAGEMWDALVAEAVRRGLWGFENLSGIPGTVGASPIQNIGAYGTEVKNVIKWVEVLDVKTGEVRKLMNKECGFGYRDSVFKRAEGRLLVVTRVAFRLAKKGTPNLEYKDLRESFKLEVLTSKEERERRLRQITLQDIRRMVLQIRSRKFPDLKEFGTAGSFFKNPIIPEAQFNELKKKFPNLPGFPPLSMVYGLPSVKIPLAWVLDNICGLKGFEKGNVKLFEKQPIVLVHNGRASAKEVEAFATEIVAKVKKETGIVVEWEVQRIM